MSQSRKRGFEDLPPALLPTILAFVPGVKAKYRLATVAKQWLAALASSESYSHDALDSLPPWWRQVVEARPDPPVLQQDVLAALATSGIEFCLLEGCESGDWLPPTVRRLYFAGCLPEDCATLACVENVRVTFLEDCTDLDVTKFPSARVLEASFERVLLEELEGAPWLGQLVALPQLTTVVLDWGGISPGNFLIQLPTGCELVISTSGTTLSESLPHCAGLAHLVNLSVWGYDTRTPVEFSCLAGCPNLKDVSLVITDMDEDLDLTNLDWVDLSTLNHVPPRCSIVLDFTDAHRFFPASCRLERCASRQTEKSTDFFQKRQLRLTFGISI